MLGRRDIDVNYDWTPHVGRYCNDDILRGDYWKQRKAESPSDLRPRTQEWDTCLACRTDGCRRQSDIRHYLAFPAPPPDQQGLQAALTHPQGPAPEEAERYPVPDH